MNNNEEFLHLNYKPSYKTKTKISFHNFQKLTIIGPLILISDFIIEIWFKLSKTNLLY